MGEKGFTLISAVIGLLLSALLLSAGMSALSHATQTQTREDLALEMEQNLRVATDTLADSVRMAGSGIPTSNLPQWIPWVAFVSDGLALTTSPTTLSEAHCTPYPILSINTLAAAGDTVLSVASEISGFGVGELVDIDSQRLIAIDDDTFAHIVDVATGSGDLTIDVDPTTPGNQGLPRVFGVGTPICRVDVNTFELATDPVSGREVLGTHANDGTALEYLANGIIGLDFTTLVAGERYEIAVHARSERPAPTTGIYLQRTMTRVVSRENS